MAFTRSGVRSPLSPPPKEQRWLLFLFSGSAIRLRRADVTIDDVLAPPGDVDTCLAMIEYATDEGLFDLLDGSLPVARAPMRFSTERDRARIRRAVIPSHRR